MPNIKTFYALDNPLDCMFFARDLVWSLSSANNSINTNNLIKVDNSSKVNTSIPNPLI
jgi:hypothetical protein